MDISKAPKQFCENVTIAFGNDHFVVGLLAGDELGAYVLTPAHMKRLQQYLDHQIAAFEKQYGDITTEAWDPNIKSPIQLSGK